MQAANHTMRWGSTSCLLNISAAAVEVDAVFRLVLTASLGNQNATAQVRTHTQRKRM
jgi:hypothetical protein